eukprot:2737918-Amphidinium_carterae.1
MAFVHGRGGSFPIPCRRQESATCTQIGAFLALGVLQVGSALSRPTCNGEVHGIDASTEKRKSQIVESWRREGLQVVDCSVRFDLSAVSREIHASLNGHSRAHAMFRLPFGKKDAEFLH